MHKKQFNFLKNKFEQDQLSHAYLFSGQKGLGKKNIAEKFSEFVGCKFPDLKIISEANKRDEIFGDGGEIKISQIKEVQDFLAYKSYNGGFKIVIIDGAEKMNQEAQSCLLKTLEEPKGKAIIFLISSRSNMLLETVRSRCQVVKFFGKPVQSLEELSEENRILQNFLEIMDRDFSERFKYAKSFNFETQSLNKTLEVLQKHFRNLLFSKIEAGESVSKLKTDIKLIEDIDNKITFTNANPKLALEALLMEI